MQVDDLVAFANVVVHMAVDGFVVIHAAGNQNFRLVFAKQAQIFGIQQLADAHGVAAALQLQFEQKIALIFPNGVFVQNQKVQCHRGPPFWGGAASALHIIKQFGCPVRQAVFFVQVEPVKKLGVIIGNAAGAPFVIQHGKILLFQ